MSFLVSIVSSPDVSVSQTQSGEVVEGMETVTNMEKQGSDSGQTKSKIIITDSGVVQ